MVTCPDSHLEVSGWIGSLGGWGCESGFVASQVDTVHGVMAGLGYVVSWRVSMKSVQLHGSAQPTQQFVNKESLRGPQL